MPRLFRPVAVTIGIGLLGGFGIAVFAFLLARYGPSGSNWSFRGNGALGAFALFPVLLVAGWTAIVLNARGHPSWLFFGLGAGLVALVLGVVDAALLPVFGPNVDQFVGPLLLLGLVAWTLAAPIVASRIRVPSARRAGNLPEVPGGFLWFIAVLFGEFIGGVFYPAGA